MSSYRFDLEKAVAAWRRPFEHNRAFSSEDLEELEGSLRDRVEALIEAGVPEESAFREAVRRLGSYVRAEQEYRKVYWGKVRRQHSLRSELAWRLSMFKNYLKIALRNLLRKKGYAFINIAGLTLGLASCLIIFQYVAFEYSYDTFNTNASDLYRIVQETSTEEIASNTSPLTGYALGPALAQEVPEVVRFARLHPEYSNAIISNPAQPGKVSEEERVYYADPAFFEMFSYPLVRGTPGQVLSEPGTILLSESEARKNFGSEDPMGKVLDVRGWISGTFRVGGIFEDVPVNSHLQFDFLLPMVDLLQKSRYSDPENGWSWKNFNTYVELRSDIDRTDVEHKFTDVVMRHMGDDLQPDVTVHVKAQPLRDVHLNGDILAPKVVMGSYRAVYFFSIIGLITLLVALANYINLATARALSRAKEVGVRKVVGAQRLQLVAQFLCESALTLLMAFALALALALTLRPLVNSLAGTSLTNAFWASPVFWAMFLSVFCAATLLAGLYPAFVLSSFRPVAVLKGKRGTFGGGVWLRRGLVVLQFAASIALVAGTAVVYAQLRYVQSMDTGIDLEQVLTVPGPRVLAEGTDGAEAIRTLLQELRRIPAVRQVATSSTIPGQGFDGYTDALRRAAADASTSVDGAFTWIDTSFASLYGLNLVAGEGFKGLSGTVPEGEPRPVITNETAIEALGFSTPEEAVGEVIYVGGGKGRIVGVFEDFNWSSAHEARENAIFALIPVSGRVSLKVSTENLPQTIAAIKQIYTTLFPGDPFRYAFVDEQFDLQYLNDQRFARLFSIFAGLAIAIACLGLFGLASFTAQQRTKEIGVRKVLGASVSSIVGLLSRDFLALVALGFLVAALPAYFIMQRWLENFAYRVDIGPAVFVSVGAVVLVIALLTVSYQSVKAATADPVKSLRYE